MIHVVAIVSAKPGQRPALLDAFVDIVPAVLAESGCIEYSVAIDSPDAEPAFGPHTVVVIEKWENEAALKAHAASAHMVAFGLRAKDLSAGIAIHRLQTAR
jgi:quinol monooxygenase YgiN